MGGGDTWNSPSIPSIDRSLTCKSVSVRPHPVHLTGWSSRQEGFSSSSSCDSSWSSWEFKSWLYLFRSYSANAFLQFILQRSEISYRHFTDTFAQHLPAQKFMLLSWRSQQRMAKRVPVVFTCCLVVFCWSVGVVYVIRGGNTVRKTS